MYVFKSAQWLQLVTSWSLAFVRFTFTLQQNKTVDIRTSVLGIFQTDLKSIISLEQFSIPVVKFSLSEMLHKDLIVESHSERLKSSLAP